MRLLLILIFFGASVCRGDDNDTKSWQHPEPITYESLIKWHQEGGLKKYIWPKVLNADLNADGHNEVFLGISGYGRGMVYALFTNTRNGWIMLSKDINSSHLGVNILPKKNGQWHDFESLTPSGRGGVFEFIYSWNGKNYVEKSCREISENELLGK